MNPENDPLDVVKDLDDAALDRLVATGEMVTLVVASALWHHARGQLDADMLSALATRSMNPRAFFERIEALDITATPRG